MGQLDQIIEQVAFGQTQEKMSSCLGLYLSPETIYISETHLGKDGKLVVDHLVRIPIPADPGKTSPGATATMNTDFLSDPNKIGGLVRQSMSQIRWNSKNVFVTLSHHFGLLRFFPMPPMERRFMKTAVPVEGKKYIPIPFDALAYDYQGAPMPPDATGRPRQGVLIAVTQKKNVTNIQGLAAALGLKLVGLEVAPCSVLRLWQIADPPKGPETFAQAHFDPGGVRVMVCDRGLPVFFREVFLSGDAMLADQRKVDLTGCLTFVQKQLSLAAVSRVRLSGSSANIPQWKDALAAETSLPAEIQDTAKLLSIKGGDWGAFAAIGASARALKPGALLLDLGAVERVSDEEKQTARDLLLLGAVVAAFIGVLGLLKTASYTYKAREIEQYQVDADVRMALDNRPAMDIDEQLKNMRNQVDQLRTVVGSPRPKLSVMLKEIVDVMPERVWLKKISVINPLSNNDRVVGEINLLGNAQGASLAEEQDLAFQFKEALIRSPILGKGYEVQLSVSAKPADSSMEGLSPAALSKKLEERTEFSMTLRTKK